MRLALVLAAMLLATPAQALTMTWTDVTFVSLDLPISDHGGLLTYDFLFGPTELPEWEETNFSGNLFVLGCNMNCHHPDMSWVQIDCNADPLCHVTGSLGVGPMTPHEFFVQPSLGFLVSAYFPMRPLISGVVTFTMPDPVPIPAALPLLAAGLAGLGFIAWRRK